MLDESATSVTRNWQVARKKLVKEYTAWLGHLERQVPIKSIEPKVNMEVPTSLRRSKRRSSVLASPNKSQSIGQGKHDSQFYTAAQTPARRSKRVRFSEGDADTAANSTSTGITPFMKRSSLTTPRRRHSTPAKSDFSVNIEFTPFRQILDDRTKRRILRHGLSDEMNQYEADKKTKTALQQEIDEKDAELKKLKLELEQARKQSPQPHSLPPIAPASQQRVEEVEAELEALRQSFALDDVAPVENWDFIPRSSVTTHSDGGDTIQIWEDDEDATPANDASTHSDALNMGLELQAARLAKQSLLGSFRESSTSANINFADSPARRSDKAVGPSPRLPRTFYHDLSKQLKATTSRAEDAELALKTLELEVRELGFGDDSSSAVEAASAIAAHFRLMRLELERALPGENVIGFENSRVLPELLAKMKALLKQIRHKETELRSAKDQHHNLAGNFEKAISAAERAQARVKDLEAAIDLQAEETLNVRIRSQRLEKSLAEKEKDMESLKEALGKYRSDVSRLEQLITDLEQEQSIALAERDQTISDLDAKVAAEERGRHAAEASAVSRRDKINELESALADARKHAASIEADMASLQTRFSTSDALHSTEIGALNTRISNLSTALASANAEVEKLKMTKVKLEDRVRHEVEQGARAVEAIQNDFIRSVARANEDKKRYIRGAKVRIANWELEEWTSSDGLESPTGTEGDLPTTPASLVRFAEYSEEFGHGKDDDDDADDEPGRGRQEYQTIQNEDGSEYNVPLPASVQISRGKGRGRSTSRARGLTIQRSESFTKPRRRYDSGIGMSSDCEGDDDGIKLPGPGLLTPDLSSEADHGNAFARGTGLEDDRNPISA